MIVLGAIFLGEKLEERFERDLFIIIMVEMLLLGLILKATYYLYMHPWEDMNPRHKTNVLWHKVTVYTLGQKLLAMLNPKRHGLFGHLDTGGGGLWQPILENAV